MLDGYIRFILYNCLEYDEVEGRKEVIDWCNLLNEIIFDPVDEYDENLVGHGVELRRLYFEKTGLWPQEGPCTMLEMLAGLALSCDEMLSPAPDKTTGFHFFKYMLTNLLGNADADSVYSLCANYRFSIFGIDEYDQPLWVQANRIDWESVIF